MLTVLKQSTELSVPFSLHSAIVYNVSGPPHYRGFTIILRHITLGRTCDQPETGTSDITHSQNRQTSMQPTGLELIFPTSERPHTHVPFRADTGFGTFARFPSIITNGSKLTYFQTVASHNGMNPWMLTVASFYSLKCELGIMLSHGITKESSLWNWWLEKTTRPLLSKQTLLIIMYD